MVVYFYSECGLTGGNFTFGVTDTVGCFSTGTELVVVNPTPDATGLTGTTCSNSKASGSLAGSVSGGTPPYIFSQAGPAQGGIAFVSPTGAYTFTPNPGVTGGSFPYQVSDANGCKDSATVFINVNLGPIASPGFFTGCDNGFNGTLVPLVTGANPPFNFSGPVGPVLHGTVTINMDGTFTFVPNVTIGQGSFNYIVSDSSVPPCTSNPTPRNDRY